MAGNAGLLTLDSRCVAPEPRSLSDPLMFDPWHGVQMLESGKDAFPLLGWSGGLWVGTSPSQFPLTQHDTEDRAARAFQSPASPVVTRLRSGPEDEEARDNVTEALLRGDVATHESSSALQSNSVQDSRTSPAYQQETELPNSFSDRKAEPACDGNQGFDPMRLLCDEDHHRIVSTNGASESCLEAGVVADEEPTPRPLSLTEAAETYSSARLADAQLSLSTVKNTATGNGPTTPKRRRLDPYTSPVCTMRQTGESWTEEDLFSDLVDVVEEGLASDAGAGLAGPCSVQGHERPKDSDWDAGGKQVSRRSERGRSQVLEDAVLRSVAHRTFDSKQMHTVSARESSQRSAVSQRSVGAGGALWQTPAPRTEDWDRHSIGAETDQTTGQRLDAQDPFDWTRNISYSRDEFADIPYTGDWTTTSMSATVSRSSPSPEQALVGSAGCHTPPGPLACQGTALRKSSNEGRGPCSPASVSWRDDGNPESPPAVLVDEVGTGDWFEDMGLW